MTRDACGGGRARRHAEDRPRAPNVRVHARLSDPQTIGDLLRRETGRHRPQDLPLALGQRLGWHVKAREHAPGDQISGEQTEDQRRGALHLER
jgi:hypothetical protein